jgi:hypothetical protein
LSADERQQRHSEAQSRYRTSPKGRETQRRYRERRPEIDRDYYYDRGGREQQSIRRTDAKIAEYRDKLAEQDAATP